VRETLYDLGLRIHLNHQGRPCPNPHPPGRRFTLIDVSGTWSIHAVFCNCRSHLPGNSKRAQLMRYGWFPATWSKPCTAFTYDLLKSYHVRSDL
jgi:hypothetical protein